MQLKIQFQFQLSMHRCGGCSKLTFLLFLLLNWLTKQQRLRQGDQKWYKWEMSIALRLWYLNRHCDNNNYKNPTPKSSPTLARTKSMGIGKWGCGWDLILEGDRWIKITPAEISDLLTISMFFFMFCIINIRLKVCWCRHFDQLMDMTTTQYTYSTK